MYISVTTEIRMFPNTTQSDRFDVGKSFEVSVVQGSPITAASSTNEAPAAAVWEGNGFKP